MREALIFGVIPDSFLFAEGERKLIRDATFFYPDPRSLIPDPDCPYA